jgi:hypothetical protein
MYTNDPCLPKSIGEFGFVGALYIVENNIDIERLPNHSRYSRYGAGGGKPERRAMSLTWSDIHPAKWCHSFRGFQNRQCRRAGDNALNWGGCFWSTS